MTTITTTTFEQATEKLGKEMMALYDTDEDGQPIVLDGDSLTTAQQTVDEAKKAAIKSFGPLYDQLQQELAKQQGQIGALEAKLAAPAAPTASAASAAVDDNDDDDVVPDFPALEWLAENHKGKGEKLSGFNVATIWHNKKFGTAPAKGWWAKQDQKPWVALAAQYSAHLTASKVSVLPSLPVPASFAAQAFALTPQQIQVALAAPAPAPQAEQAKVKESKATCAYQLWVAAWKAMPENKGKIFPPAGSWKNVPAAEKAIYQAKFKALEASRAVRA